MQAKSRTAAEQLFWDQVYLIALEDLLRKDGRSNDIRRINLAGARADGALDARRRSTRGDQR